MKFGLCNFGNGKNERMNDDLWGVAFARVAESNRKNSRDETHIGYIARRSHFTIATVI